MANDKRRIPGIKYAVKSSAKEYAIAERQFDLESRTMNFAKGCIDTCTQASKNAINAQLVGQLVRAAGSVGANYREANDSITKRDFYYRTGICRREAKEAKYWLELLQHSNTGIADSTATLIDEALQLARIFAAINKKQDH